MPVVVKSIVNSKYAENTLTRQYTANGVTTIIDKFTITNIGAANVTVSIYLVPSGTQEIYIDDSSRVVKTRTIAPSETYLLPEIVGQVLNPGDYLCTIASAASALNIRASGREIS